MEDLDLLTFLPLAPQCWDCSCGPPLSSYLMFFLTELENYCVPSSVKSAKAVMRHNDSSLQPEVAVHLRRQSNTIPTYQTAPKLVAMRCETQISKSCRWIDLEMITEIQVKDWVRKGI